MKTVGASPQCYAMQVSRGWETEIAAGAGGSDDVCFDFSQRESERIEGLKSMAGAGKAITCVRFRRLFFGYFLWTIKETNK
jgi:hypothetical protein